LEEDPRVEVSAMSAGKRVFFNAGFASMIVFLPLLTGYFAISIVHYDAALVVPDAAFWSHVEPPSLASVGFSCGSPSRPPSTRGSRAGARRVHPWRTGAGSTIA
jgi:hypothetical protein